MTTPARRIIVLGAGGRTGRLIVDAALRNGYRTVALLRSPERAGPGVRDNLEFIAADARNAGSIRRVLEPDDVIISAIGPSGRKSEGLYASVARAVVAADDSGRRRFIGITSSGVRDDDLNHPWWYRTFFVPFMKNTYGDMREMESAVEQSTLAWTFVRPGRLSDEPASGNYRVEDGMNPKGGVSISRSDVAEFVISCVEDPHWLRKKPTITQ
jgi:putative NADH-flavin reductase